VHVSAFPQTVAQTCMVPPDPQRPSILVVEKSLRQFCHFADDPIGLNMPAWALVQQLEFLKAEYDKHHAAISRRQAKELLETIPPRLSLHRTTAPKSRLRAEK